MPDRFESEPYAEEIARLRGEVEALKVQLASAVVNAAINAHCPGCNCFEDDTEPETMDVFDPTPYGPLLPGIFDGFGRRYPALIIKPSCSECQGRKGLPHWPRCQREGIVTEVDCQEEPRES